MTTQLLRLPDVVAMTKLSRSTLYAMVADGAFPKQVRLSKRCVGWPADSVENWIRSRIMSRVGT